ncbi:(2Fe-2S)-binding protein [Streptomyces sp. H10-C2]|uniref:(2Fe-2S)-binding protein n=1 Tax=unclassified Streptomyces TaxID=2593676 RepID=UPI0024B91D8C|nr:MULTISPECIES: (2Fe-2S)-binding protein [unclassified Streptomyces]MDJ0340744.1 (2Fe-2S)-binding protein [Streptomyces sp. PH10-H1]MDJ0371984.1 (2Fe-2S)-binding protein [Streptomyces sp. H10-C2]
MRVTFNVNGRPQEADDVWEGESLLYVLRERMGLPGSKNACEQGECGSCTVRLDGVPVCACLVAAAQVQDRDVVTVEGLADYARDRAAGRCGTGACGTPLGEAQKWAAKPSDGQTGEAAELSPIQAAFIDAGAVQCGFCTPGLLVAADELLERNPSPSDQDIREALSGNLCRCTGYEKILDAVRLASLRAGVSPPEAGEESVTAGEGV